MRKLFVTNSLIIFFFVFLSFLITSPVYSSTGSEPKENIQVSVSGIVVDAQSGQPLGGVNVIVRGTIIGVATNARGEFSLNINDEPPITLLVSIIGYTSQEIEITGESVTDLRIELREETILGSDIVVSASRVEESILEAPVSIEKMDIIAVAQNPSPSYYQGLANLKGVDMTTSSINFQIVNARGFNSTGNTRMVQLTDGMDTQAPALNFPIGNLNGPSVLDVESVEFIPGASSALYGPNAFNGILLVNSKSPFRYPGLSVHIQNGFNHIDGNSQLGEPGDPQHMFEGSLRYAKVLGNDFAFKLNVSYSQANDWRGVNFSDKNSSLAPSGVDRNPAFDGVHLYGDDGTFNLALLGFNRSGSFQEGERGFIENLALQFFGGNADAAQNFAMNNLPNQPVARTGYREEFLIDADAENFKIGTGLHYRINDNVEASYNMNYGSGTSVYSGAQRYSLNNFYIHQHKLQLEGDNFMVRAYGTFENSGDSYIADFVGFSVNDQYMPTTQWYGIYGISYLGYLLNPQTGSDANAAHIFARNTADTNRFEPGTQQFENAKQTALQSTVPNGARLMINRGFYILKANMILKMKLML